MPQESKLVHEMAWCHQASSHYLSHYWLRSMSPFDATKGAFTPTLSEHLYPCLRPWQNCVYTTSEARIRGHPRSWPFCTKFGTNHMNRWLWACTFHNLGRTRMSASKEITTCSDELGHGCPRQKSRIWTRISVNKKHQFTCFDCVRARTQMLGPISRM